MCIGYSTKSSRRNLPKATTQSHHLHVSSLFSLYILSLEMCFTLIGKMGNRNVCFKLGITCGGKITFGWVFFLCIFLRVDFVCNFWMICFVTIIWLFHSGCICILNQKPTKHDHAKAKSHSF
jgi:hypothetical protein